jgi:hypothetical protein
MKKPRFIIRATRIGWHFYKYNSIICPTSYIGVIAYNGMIGIFCDQYLKENPHLK